jgi:preprotein translocase subunit SecA
MIRLDNADLVYLAQKEKFNAIIEDIKDCRKRSQPVLVGTTSIETSEYLSRLLQKEDIPHQVLNAKYHEKEAEIVAQAGRPGTVTIATNMAGRGTDIVLGGSLDADLGTVKEQPEELKEKVREAWQKRHEQVVAAGGLHIIGTERHESRRVDNQLRGRSGRQGDPGSSRFYLSLEDNLMRIFASDRLGGLMQKLGMQEGEAIEHPWVTKAIENAQRRVEGRNFDIRKQLLEYDDVANDQRKVIYEQRNELMDVEDISETVSAIRRDVVNGLINTYIPPESLEEQWDLAGLTEALEREFGLRVDIASWLSADRNLPEEILRSRIMEEMDRVYADKEAMVGPQVMRHFEKAVMLQMLDNYWKEHLAAMDYLRQGIHLRGYAQKNPKQEYKREAFEMFTQLLDRIKYEVISVLAKVQVHTEQDVQQVEEQRRSRAAVQYQHAHANGMGEEEEEPATSNSHTPYVRQAPKVGRNEPCPCGSGKKYKHCHGKLQ